MSEPRQEVFSSEALTRGVRVSVESWFDPSRSKPEKSHWFFLYRVRIANEGEETVQLLNRHWVITDGAGKVQEVTGPGVVGEQPTLAPGEDFTYTSGCPLATEIGMMGGTYEMVTASQEVFRAEIAGFTLSLPYTAH